MSSQSPKPSMPRPTSRGQYLIRHRAPWTAAFPHASDHSAAASRRLYEHMLRDHGRTGRETDGLPLADLHRFEHVEQAMGLNDLGHRHHPGGLGTDTRISAEHDESTIANVLA
jgi:hypothetical protein